MVRSVSSKTGVGNGSVANRMKSLAGLNDEAQAKNKQKRQHVANVKTEVVDEGITQKSPMVKRTMPSEPSTDTAAASSMAVESSLSSAAVDPKVEHAKARKTMAITLRGDQSEAMAVAADEDDHLLAFCDLDRDTYASTATGPRMCVLKTWTRFHVEWFRPGVPIVLLVEPLRPYSSGAGIATVRSARRVPRRHTLPQDTNGPRLGHSSMHEVGYEGHWSSTPVRGLLVEDGSPPGD